MVKLIPAALPSCLRRSFVRAILAGLVVGFISAVVIPQAYAYVSSTSKTFLVNGSDYYVFSYGQKTNEHTGTYVSKVSQATVPVGNLGARARIYFDDGTLCTKSAMFYNNSPTSRQDTHIENPCGGFIYAKGVSKVWNGTNYKTVYSNRTPNWYG